MKAKIILLCAITAAIAATGGWFAARKFSAAHSHEPASPAGSGRKILYYQSAMHPWIKSDKPGRCTICGMELSPVFEGDKGFEAGEGFTTLGSNIIQVISVQSEEVRRRPLQRVLRVAGTIDDNDARHRVVSAYMDGRIDRLAVNFVGAEVVAGQPLATFYSPVLLAAEREYAALLKRKFASDSPSLIAGHDRLVAAAGQRLKRLGLTDAQIAVLAAKSDDDIHTELLVPVSGTVVARHVYEGQYVKEGEKLFEIADFSTMWFLFDAYERDLAWLKMGQSVEVSTPAAPGRTFAGKVAFIDPNLKEMTRSAKVRVELPNPLVATNGQSHRELFHKLYAEAVVRLEIPEVLAVPRLAVLAPGPQAVAYVDKSGGAYEQRRLKLGRIGDDHWEVLDGLAEGERVVIAGNMLIDAQAQLNVGVSQTPEQAQQTNGAASEVTGALPALSKEQYEASHALLNLADALTAALAADKLSDFNQHAAKTPGTVTALTTTFAGDNPWRPLLNALNAAVPVASANDLKSARKNFHSFSEAAVAFAKALRRQKGDFKSLKIFRCPMTKDSFPGAPRSAEWLQLKPEIRNPYFGAEMLDCGSEVK